MVEIFLSLSSTRAFWYSTRRAIHSDMRADGMLVRTLGVVDEEGRNEAAIELETLDHLHAY